MSDSAIMHLLRRDEKSLVRDGGLYFVAEMSESFSRTFRVLGHTRELQV